eukprot:CAMPEP_0197942306 /NCGR_PEP_ID=MMETSP1439-20131203/124158_1 /TAXON_ID=66791 /ORGANISM="Gonyaulax spinifera, Strain CCMP409" /LENGTH=81 /DNA_ID=CAMNT_0043565555 /DNA_START=120 /DNA_END=362 /DNA_ORIENTATION=+
MTRSSNSVLEESAAPMAKRVTFAPKEPWPQPNVEDVSSKADACARTIVSLLEEGQKSAAESHLIRSAHECKRKSCKAFYHS